MKVLFVLENTMDSLEGGTEVSSRHLTGLLRKQGIEVEEWSPFNVRKPIFWYTSLFGQLYILIVLLWKLVRNRIKIVHVQGKYLLPPAVISGKLLKIPTVATIRDYIVVCPIGLCLFDFKKGVSLLKQGDSLIYTKHGFPFFFFHEISDFLSTYHKGDHLTVRIVRYVFLIRGWLTTWWLRFWLKQADAVISVSKYVQRMLEVNGIKSEVIYNTFNPVFTMGDPRSMLTTRRRLTASRSRRAQLRGSDMPADPPAGGSGPVRILFVGKPSYGKGYDLFRSLSANKLFEKYEFVTIGGDNKLPYLETLKRIKGATAVVVPSRWPEPFGRVAMESLMLGTPVIATTRGGLPEIVEDGVTGRLADADEVSLADALSEIIKRNMEFRIRIRDHQKKLQYNFGTIPARKHIGLYRGLIQHA